MTQEDRIAPSLSIGPFVSAACFAEHVLTETDNAHSLIRIIDRIQVAITARGEMKELPKTQHSLTLFVSLKCGGERGSHELEIIPVKPSGERLPSQSNPVHFEGPEYKGVNIIAKMAIEISGEGTWWFEIRHRKQLLTKIPLNVIFQIQTRKPANPT